MSINAFVIDDDEASTDLLCQTLNNIRNVTAYPSNPNQYSNDLEQALCEGRNFDVIFLDYIMPGLTCKEALTEITKLYNKHRPGHGYPIIAVCSGIANLQEVVQKIRAGTPSFPHIVGLSKSLNQDEIQRFILNPLHFNESSSKKRQQHTDTQSLDFHGIDIDGILLTFAKYKKGKLSEEELRNVLEVVNPEELSHIFHTSVLTSGPTPKANIIFADTTGDSLVGVAAFSWEDVHQLRNQHQNNPIILITNDGGPETIENLSLINGLVVIGRRASHLKRIALAAGISCLMIDRDLAEQRGFSLNAERGELQQYGQDFISIQSGALITLDTRQNCLYKGSLPIIKPIIPESYYELLQFINSDLRNFNYRDFFSFQADTRAEIALSDGLVGISRMENYFLNAEASELLRLAIKSPTAHRINSIRQYTDTYISSLFQDIPISFFEPAFRLMDFKSDQIFSTAEATNLQEAIGLQNIRGFLPLARQRREVFQAQVEGLIIAAKKFLAPHTLLRLVVPDVKGVEELQLAKEILHESLRRCVSPLPVAIGAMIESVEGIVNLNAIISELAQDHPSTSLLIQIGGADLTSSLLGDIQRHNDVAIAKCMVENGWNINPFSGLFPGLRRSLEHIMGTVKNHNSRGHNINVSFCGPQASSISFISFLESIGVHHVCIPSTAFHKQGLINAFALRRWQTLRKHSEPLRQLHSRVIRDYHLVISSLG